MSSFPLSCPVESLPGYENVAAVDVLRLDKLHPLVSGNKWFKLKEYLALARTRRQTVLTFGGAFSNHIVATAAAAQLSGLACIGIIRGEETAQLSHTLLQAKEMGMQLFFISREAYRQKEIPPVIFQHYSPSALCIIPEGGYGAEGVAGARDILQQHPTNSYTHILLAVGTGTTLAGLTLAALPHQQVVGIVVLKNLHGLQKEINFFLPTEKQQQFRLLHDYHFGGYAKKNPQLFDFMNGFYRHTGVPTDFVYTGKAFFAADALLQAGWFPPGSKLLLVHTGGLQGNLSLPKGTLIFG